MKTTKTQGRWTPIRKGPIYCSPACGGGCTYQQYKATQEAAKRALKRMDRQSEWEIHVHENLGWFWTLKHESGLLTVSGGQLPYKNDPAKGFHAMLSASGSGGCDAQWFDHRTFDDPNDAVDHRLALARNYMRSVIKLVKRFEKKEQQNR